jgi:hypothetical protein
VRARAGGSSVRASIRSPQKEPSPVPNMRSLARGSFGSCAPDVLRRVARSTLLLSNESPGTLVSCVRSDRIPSFRRRFGHLQRESSSVFRSIRSPTQSTVGLSASRRSVRTGTGVSGRSGSEFSRDLLRRGHGSPAASPERAVGGQSRVVVARMSLPGQGGPRGNRAAGSDPPRFGGPAVSDRIERHKSGTASGVSASSTPG